MLSWLLKKKKKKISLSYRQGYSWACSLQQREVTGPLWRCSLVSRGGGVWIRKSQQDPHYPVSAPQTRVCVHEGSGQHVCIPAWGRDPLPACRVLRPGPLHSVEPPTNEHGRGGGGSEESSGLLHLSAVARLRRAALRFGLEGITAHLIFTLT